MIPVTDRLDVLSLNIASFRKDLSDTYGEIGERGFYILDPETRNNFEVRIRCHHRIHVFASVALLASAALSAYLYSAPLLACGIFLVAQLTVQTAMYTRTRSLFPGADKFIEQIDLLKDKWEYSDDVMVYRNELKKILPLVAAQSSNKPLKNLYLDVQKNFEVSSFYSEEKHIRPQEILWEERRFLSRYTHCRTCFEVEKLRHTLKWIC